MSTSDLRMTGVPSSKAEMLIRRPVSEVFEAFVDPAVTTRFWFSHGSGRLAPAAEVTWVWDMYGVSSTVLVKEFEQDKRLVIEWTSEEHPTTVEWVFTARPDNTTLVSITESGFTGDGDTVAAHAMGSVEGFTLVLAGLKALLEHKIELNLVSDRFPDGL